MIGLRRLPIPLAPAHQETIASWLHRLATVHGMATGELRHHLRVGPKVSDEPDQRRVLAHTLAALTGSSAGALAQAVPELRVPPPDWSALRHMAQRACPRCSARHNGGPVRRLFGHHEYLCLRHGYWIGPPDPTRDDAPSRLAVQLPALVVAQRRLQRTAQRHGWAAAFNATAVATKICVDLRLSAIDHPLWTRWDRRLDVLMPAGYRRSVFMAVIFPEVAAIAGILAQPDWRDLAPQHDPADQDRLIDAVQHAVGCADPPRRHDISEALIIWMTTRAAGPPLQPAATYPDTGHHGDGVPRITDQYRLAEHLTVVQFRRDPRAPRSHSPAAPLPYAHRPAETAVPAGRSS